MKQVYRLNFTILAMVFFVVSAFGQKHTITGTLTDSETGEALIGATILEKGTSNGTITDIDGNYDLTVSSAEALLVFSYVGYANQELSVNGRTRIDVALGLDLMGLEEVVVVGYGTQQKKDLTSSIATIKSEEITKTPTNSAMQSLQGKVAGVQIVSSGEPGAGPTVRVRGVGTLQGDSRPLYVVDGMFFDDINFLNPADIESISVLKDASAAAIYGVRAANGVVLVQTKGGAYGKETTITYDGYWGVQRAQNVLEMAGTELFTQYALSTGADADASFINNAFQRYGRSRTNTTLPAVDTDWYDEVLQNTSPIQNHTLTASGGSESAKYSLSVGYLNQEGLVKVRKNSYERFNFRTKVDVNLRDWIDVGGNINVTRSEQHVAPNSVWFNTYFAVPIFPAYDETNVNAYPLKLGNARNLGYRGRQNPFFEMYNGDDQNLVTKLVGNMFADIEIIPNKLHFKYSYNYDYNSLNVRNVNFEYNDGTAFNRSSIYKRSASSFHQIVNNLLTYNENIGKHSFTAMAGYAWDVTRTSSINIRVDSALVNPSFDNEELWYSQASTQLDLAGIGDGGSSLNITSYIGRLSYNYDNRYLVYGTLRRDGTNKFQKKWGLFPTIGLGWVISEESFLNVNYLDFLKLRGSWGKLGNANVPAADGEPSYDVQDLAIDDQLETGIVAVKQFDYLGEGETTVETNIGITANAFNSRLSVDADYYVRETENAAVTIILPLVRANVRRNLGSIKNQGVEMNINWADNLANGIKYNLGLNFATLKNEVTDLGGQQYLNAGSAEFRQRSILGQPIEAFYGYEVEGIFQNAQEITNSGLIEDFIADNSIEPSDFKYKDQNDDGVIDDLDRVVLGSNLPSLTYGFNLGAGYKQFELSANFQGQRGFSILNRKRGEVIFTTDANLDAELLDNLWTGEGTSNKYPSAAGLRKGYNQSMSDYFVEDGSYFRIQNVRLSYNLPQGQLFGKDIPETRISLTAEKPLTVFDYNGFNPEVASGIDRQTYPIPAVYTIGVNLKL